MPMEFEQNTEVRGRPGGHRQGNKHSSGQSLPLQESKPTLPALLAFQ